ncbi:hypothetical protein [Pantoea stewartii]|uniref:hypothetical protein n=1 Tax=Pantoea stewartii TaxID=66269 RepID=UPI00197F61D3|nr:hypothetical protein [Pantoea stewartii]
MTTNSPNPVDGDVQALIGLCKIEIKRWKAASETKPNMRYMVALMEAALASLMSQPGIFEWRFKDTEGSLPSPWVTLGMDKLEQCQNTFGDMVEYRFWFPAPPAQFLRPVELPDCDYGAVSHMSGGSKDYCNGFVDGTNNAIKAIREAGYEVKQ